MDGENQKIMTVQIDDRGINYKNPFIAREKQIAMDDLVYKNYFSLKNGQEGPYNLFIRIIDFRAILQIGNQKTAEIIKISIPLMAYMKTVKDYFQMCETYYESINHLPPDRIESLDMGRRAIHNEAAEMLMKSLEPWAKVDHITARQLFTLICVLLSRG
jgi:uncharacterized protein (UPF0262 family)